MRQAWQAQWANMSPSERRLLTVAAWLAGLTLVVMVGVRPAWRTLQTVPTQMQAVEAELARWGWFDWDPSPGNLLDDGQQISVFDFGYMWPFDPLHEFNSNGLADPQFHVPERLETRTLSGLWLDEADPLPLFRHWREPGTAATLGRICRWYLVGMVGLVGGIALLSAPIMTIVPAKVAGCDEVIACLPPNAHRAMIAGCHLSGADRIFRIGGAQAIAAMAFGTESVPTSVMREKLPMPL